MSQYTAFDLDNLFEQHFFSNLDYYFAGSMARAFDEKEPIVLISCALVSKLLFEGHICLDIQKMSGTVRSVSQTSNDLVKFPDLNIWINALEHSLMISDNIQTPLVLDCDHKLYFSKYYNFQNRLSKNIAQRVSLKPSNMDEAIIDEMLELYFPKPGKHYIHQKKAVKNAVFNYFTIISGGPGTGKTYVTTVIKKMFLLSAEKLSLPAPEIICVAPTGKAASKMDQGSTIHSILKPLKNRPGFYYNKNNPLQIDLIIIDEASMIDISLLTRLLEAVPLEAKVIILGDQHQLSSIQAGSIFSDICSVKGLFSNIFFLEYNFRSKGKTGIENLSKAINNNDGKCLEEILISGRYPDLVFENFQGNVPIVSAVKKYILEGYKPFVIADTVEAAVNELDNFKILCAHNSGEYGTLQINHVCENILRSDNNFDIQGKLFKKIIMVNTNDYKKGLFNGDTGIVLEKKGESTVFFKSLENKIKQYRASDLPGHDAAYAITIHKSQGSEFKTVLIIVPDKLSPVMTRQLLYTGVTRAKTNIIIIGNIEIIKKAINLSVRRNSGLSMCLEKEIYLEKEITDN
ncbi:MAG: exodeoxyribonuclease V subunit alpha [Desulfobacula sp.]|uniref:exodeoxyribonuclease V subunit alpha n=1 Tax=Desulfobacula sp. TaxID=2593537 RepID=UPI0025BB20FF|nr:exodeoxyribonuclease V subunit alpha [Desulfobacula sp.]MCD4722260.1 exodeoxyribonuclease V subunit alpha [Desulfobacula sp.]